MRPSFSAHTRILAAHIVLALAAMSSSAASPASGGTSLAVPAGAVVARVFFADRADLAALSERLDIWEVRHAEGLLVARLKPAELVDLVQRGYRVEIDADRTAQLDVPSTPLPGQTAGIPGYPCYRTVEESYTVLAGLEATYPQLVRQVDIGDSWDKVTPGGAAGYDIRGIVITNEAIPGPKPVFFLMAAIHAREYATAEIALRFAELVLAGYGSDPDFTWLVDRCELHVVPITNPDGRKYAEQGYSWRKNTDNNDGCGSFPDYGTDLNRNHSYRWNQGGSSGNPCDGTYHGPSAASEPEVQAIESYIASVFPDQRGPADTDPAPIDAWGLVITLHSYSELVLWPWGFTATPAPNGTQLQTLGRKLAYFNDYEPSQSIDLYPTSGTTDDWSYGVLGVASYTFEVGTSFFQSCTSFESTVWPDNRDALLFAFKACRRPYQEPAGPDPIGVALAPPVVLQGQTSSLTATVTDTRYRTGSGEPTQVVAEARYTLDLPPFDSGAVPTAMTATDGVFDESVEGVQATLATSSLTPGRHTLYVEGRDAAGSWGVPGAAFLCVATAAQAVIVDPASMRRDVAAGIDVPYEVTVTNTGTSTETFAIAVTGNAWTTSAPTSVGPLAPCGSATFTVTVTVPAGAASCATDVATVTASGPGAADAAVLTTVVDALQGAQITAPAATCAASTGNTASVPPQGAGATYSWTLDGGAVTAGQGTPAITFTAGGAGMAHLEVLVGHPAGCAITRVHDLVVHPRPSPSVGGMTGLCVGASLVLTAQGGPFSSYLWYKDGVAIPSATSPTYTKTNTTIADAGAYSVFVTDDKGCSTMSPPVNVTLAVEPTMTVPDTVRPEGNTGSSNASFTVALSSNYCIDVSVDYTTAPGTATAGSDFTPVSGTLTLTPGQTVRSIVVPVIGDFVDEADEAFRLLLSNPTHAVLTRTEAQATIQDDDTAGVSATPATGLQTTESGGTATFVVKLTSQPVASVATVLSSSDATEGTVTPGSLTFTAANWSTAQTVTVRGVDDSLLDGNIPYSVVLSPATSADPGYSGLNPADVGVTNLDNDVAEIVVTPTSGLVTTEGGAEAHFVMVPKYQPTAPVTVSLSSSDTSEGTVWPPSLTFQPATWAHPRKVTVTGVTDAQADGTQAFTIVTGTTTSEDLRFHGLNPADVAVSTVDATGGASIGSRLDLDVHGAPGTTSNLNGIFEPGEAIQLEPVWRNTRAAVQSLNGTVGGFTGPGVGYFLSDAGASYGSIPAGGTASCAASGNCYSVSLLKPATRPVLHWDARLTETLSDGTATGWIVHVGDSFADAGPAHWAYPYVEALLHNGVTTGCNPAERQYCPNDSVNRAQMAAFIARAMARGDEGVPASGTIAGKGSFDCREGGISLFADVPAAEWYCRHAHYLLAQAVTTGCDPAAGTYCPVDAVTRGAMAVFMARAVAGGDAEVPWSYTDPASGRSYDCTVASGSHFGDVPHDEWYCRHVNYLWARTIIGGCDPVAGLYCPAPAVRRDEMSKFLTNAFTLTLY